MAHSPIRSPPRSSEMMRTSSDTDVGESGVASHRSNTPADVEHVATKNPTQGAFIFRLPAEILIKIVKMAVHDSSVDPVEEGSCEDEGCTECDRPCNTSNAKSLCLVSGKFRDIAQPLLFRVVVLRSLKSSSRMRHALSENVHLRKHCRQISIVVAQDSEKKSFPMGRDVLAYLNNVQCIQLHGMVWDKEDEEIMKGLAAHADSVEHLFLTGGFWSSTFFRFINGATNFSRLTTLNIGCDGSAALFEEEEPPSLAHAKQHTSPVTSLTMGSEDQNPEHSSTLIMWAKSLEKFTFGIHGMYDSDFTIPTLLLRLTNALLVHAETLKSVDISCVVKTEHTFNAKLFPNLEYLRLSRWHMEGPLEFDEEYTKIIGPRLKTFVWNFNDHGLAQRYLLLDDFDEPEETWLCELVKAAVGLELQEIQIEFTPIRHKEMTQQLFEMGFVFPWSRMDDIRDAIMRPAGIDLTYNEPSISKDQWYTRTYDWGSDDDTEGFFEDLSDDEMEEEADDEMEEITGSESNSDV